MKLHPIVSMREILQGMSQQSRITLAARTIPLATTSLNKATLVGEEEKC
jgi:hypothetical protein